MAEQQQWFAGKPEENYGLSLASDTEAYAGHLGKARELTKRSVDSADPRRQQGNWRDLAGERCVARSGLRQPAEARQVSGSRI